MNIYWRSVRDALLLILRSEALDAVNGLRDLPVDGQ
jgi:hypothetical protein